MDIIVKHLCLTDAGKARGWSTNGAVHQVSDLVRMIFLITAAQSIAFELGQNDREHTVTLIEVIKEDF